MTTELLRLGGVGVRLGGRKVLRDVSFSIRPGELTGLTGPNSAGKPEQASRYATSRTCSCRASGPA
jgi:ABC-type branched-subunit amino acid transport system ATPase component